MHSLISLCVGVSFGLSVALVVRIDSVSVALVVRINSVSIALVVRINLVSVASVSALV